MFVRCMYGKFIIDEFVWALNVNKITHILIYNLRMLINNCLFSTCIYLSFLLRVLEHIIRL